MITGARPRLGDLLAPAGRSSAWQSARAAPGPAAPAAAGSSSMDKRRWRPSAATPSRPESRESPRLPGTPRKASSPPGASSSVNTGRSLEGMAVTRASVHMTSASTCPGSRAAAPACPRACAGSRCRPPQLPPPPCSPTAPIPNSPAPARTRPAPRRWWRSRSAIIAAGTQAVRLPFMPKDPARGGLHRRAGAPGRAQDAC